MCDIYSLWFPERRKPHYEAASRYNPAASGWGKVFGLCPTLRTGTCRMTADIKP